MPTSRVFFGWWVALSFAVMAFLASGIRFAVGPFLKPMVADLGLDRASFSLVIAVGLLLFGVLQPFVGRLVDVIGARPVLVAGTLILGGSLVATGFATQLWQLYVFNALGAGIGLAATGQVVGAAVISRWFTPDGRADGQYDFRTAFVPVAVPGGAEGVPRLGSVSPNPATGTVSIAFSLPGRADLRLDVYDVRGRHVRTLARESAGSGTRAWDGADDQGRRVRPGLYFVEMRAGDVVERARIVRLD